jgi:anti-sigma regulatory factor (Ser/Thr protein kinase)
MALSCTETFLVRLDDETGVGEARRVSRRLAAEAALDDGGVERAAIVVTEAARNAVRHGGGGFVALRAIEGPPAGIEILVADRGRGIPDVAAAMRDGHSTAGTHGQGLGAIRRLTTAFELWSAPGHGTAVVAEVRAAAVAAPPPVEIGALCVAHPGETACGDAWTAITDRAGRTVLAVVDGVGHGRPAHEAASAAIEVVLGHAALAPAEIVGLAHDALRPTRGAAMAVVDVVDGGAVRYAGVGNISAMIVDGASVRRLVSLSGTLGHEMRRVREFVYEWPPGGLLVMHSDGLGTRWDLAAYSGLATRAPALVAAVLLRDFERGRDDVTVLAARRRA